MCLNDGMAPYPARRRLDEIVLKAPAISAEALEAALALAEKTQERIGAALIAMGAVTRQDILAALALQRELSFVFREEFPSALPVLKNLSAKYLRQYTVCPVSGEGTTVTLATADPTNPLVLGDFRQLLGLQVKLCVAPRSAIGVCCARGSGWGSPEGYTTACSSFTHILKVPHPSQGPPGSGGRGSWSSRGVGDWRVSYDHEGDRNLIEIRYLRDSQEAARRGPLGGHSRRAVRGCTGSSEAAGPLLPTQEPQEPPTAPQVAQAFLQCAQACAVFSGFRDRRRVSSVKRS